MFLGPSLLVSESLIIQEHNGGTLSMKQSEEKQTFAAFLLQQI